MSNRESENKKQTKERQSNRHMSFERKREVRYGSGKEEFTVEDFHSVICRHIRRPKEQFNYGKGWKEGRKKEESKRARGGEVNWKISSSGRRQK